MYSNKFGSERERELIIVKSELRKFEELGKEVAEVAAIFEKKKKKLSKNVKKKKQKKQTK
jgi:hypothetical protein